MIIAFTVNAWNDYKHWQKHNRSKVSRVNQLIDAATRTPESGIGQPKSLKRELTGYWSRRIDREHRLVYTVTTSVDDKAILLIVQCRHHYSGS